MARLDTAPLTPGSTLFGTRNRTAILIAIRLLETTYPSELAELLGVRLFTVQQALRSFEHEQIVATRAFGRMRSVTLDPRYHAHASLAELLWALGAADHALQHKLAAKRRRPRRTGIA